MDEQMKRWLRKDIAKMCFVNCFEVAKAKNGAITEDDVRECHEEESPAEELSPLSVRNRAREIGVIFELGKEKVVLKECCINQRYSKSAEKAIILYNKYFK